MNNIKLIVCQAFIVLFIIFSGVVGVLLLNSSKDMLKLKILDYDLTRLASLNSEFDFYVLNSSLYSNFDEINKKIVEISKLNSDIEKHNVLGIVDIDKLNSAYTKKHGLAISLVSSSAKLFNIQTAAVTIGEKADMNDKTSYLISKVMALTNDLYFQTMQSDENIKEIISLIEQIKVDDKSFEESIKSKTLQALKTMLEIKAIKDDISNDFFTVYVFELVDGMDVAFEKNSVELYRFGIYLFICIFVLIVLSITLSILVNLANGRNSIILEVFKRLPIELIIFNKKQKPIFINNKAEDRHRAIYENHNVVPYFQFEDNMQNELSVNGMYVNNLYQPDRTSRTSRLSIFKMPENINKIKNYFLCKIDITGEKAESNKLKTEIDKLINNFNIDKLTGLGSPQALDEKLSNDSSGIVLFISFKDFENIRFYYSSSTIDSIIKNFANSLVTFAIESGLIISRADYEALEDDEKLSQEYRLAEKRIYHLHLDEFCFWVKDKKELLRLHGLFTQKYKEPFELVGIDGIVGSIANLEINYGVSQMADTGTDRLNQAILACYEAKKKGEFFCAYSSELKIEQQYIINQNVIQTIKDALSEQHGCKIFLQCQGIHRINLPDENGVLVKDGEGDVCYYECLVRLMDDTGKTWYPNEFLDIAKTSSLYTKITLKIMELVFDLIERTNAKFSINLSSIDMVDNEVVSHFRLYLEKCKQKDITKPSNLCIEILESESVSDYDSIRSFVEIAKEYGCKVAIDDFGSGFSNYYRLLEVDLDYLKIDGSIVKKLPIDKNARTALQSIVGFATNQNYDVVAEFVCDNDVLEEVRKLGITKVQGWAFSKPQNATDIF